MTLPLRMLLPTFVVAATALTGCSGSADSAATTPEPTASATTAVEPSASTSPTSAQWANDICELVTEAEVTAVIGPATHAANESFGSLGDDVGGQCVWTSDPGGDPFAADAANLELVVWVAGGLNPAPSEAPAAGSPDTVPVANGAYFATADRIFLIRVTGSLANDSAAVQQVIALVPTVKSRV